MITSRTSFSVMVIRIPSTCIKRIGPVEPSLGNQRATDVEPAVSHLRLIVEPVSIPAPRAEQVDDLAAAGGEELGDQPPVAAPPDRLRAHEAGSGLGKLSLEGGLPLAAATPAQFDRVAVRDPCLTERRAQRPLAELRVPPRAGEAAHVDERLHVRLPQRRHELLERTDAVAYRKDRCIQSPRPW